MANYYEWLFLLYSVSHIWQENYKRVIWKIATVCFSSTPYILAINVITGINTKRAFDSAYFFDPHTHKFYYNVIMHSNIIL